MPEYNVAITGTFFEASLAAVFYADDVAQFQSAARAAAGLDLGGEAISVQYEDADFGEYCEVDGAHSRPWPRSSPPPSRRAQRCADLTDLAADPAGIVHIRLKAPPGTALPAATATTSSSAAPATTPSAASRPESRPFELRDFPPEAEAPIDFDAVRDDDLALFAQRSESALLPSEPEPDPLLSEGVPPSSNAVVSTPGVRLLELHITQSEPWAPDGTVVSISAADLEGLCERLAQRLGLLTVALELFDEDFEEWCGPASLDEMNDSSQVRVRPSSDTDIASASDVTDPSTGAAADVVARLRAEKELLWQQQEERLKADRHKMAQLSTASLQEVYRKESQAVVEGRAAIEEKRRQLEAMRQALEEKRQALSALPGSTIAPKNPIADSRGASIVSQMASVGKLIEESATAGRDAQQAGSVPERAAVCNFLHKVPLFSDFSEADIAKLSAVCTGSSRSYSKGDFIITQGQSGDEFFLLTTGSAIATIDVPGMPPATVKHYYKGDYFGELALMRADSKRAANIVVTSGTATCIAVSRHDFQKLTDAAPASDIVTAADDGQVSAASDKLAAASGCQDVGVDTGAHDAPGVSNDEQVMLDRVIADRRRGMFDDVDDEAELVAKEALVAKIDKWLSGIGVGGSQMRGFDPTEIVQFAWEQMHENVDCDGIYRLFVENQNAEAKVRMSQAMGFEGVDPRKFQSMPASEMEAFAIRNGWLAHEIGGTKLRRKFARNWFALWHDPASPDEDLMLLVYEGQDSTQPMGVWKLQKSRFSVEPPKTPRKNRPHAFRISIEPDHAGGKPTKFILAADSELEYVEWLAALKPQKELTRSEMKKARQEVKQRESQAMEILAQRFLSEGKMKVLASTGAEELIGTARRAGWLRKEEKRGVFKRRWVTLWRHPQAKHSNDFLLLQYESKTAPAPMGIMILSPGKYSVGPPKSKRTYLLCQLTQLSSKCTLWFVEQVSLGFAFVSMAQNMPAQGTTPRWCLLPTKKLTTVGGLLHLKSCLLGTETI